MTDAGFRAEVTRPRLAAVLDRRFAGDVVLLVGGAGFGKTTLLDQAERANRLVPRGRDARLTLQAPHAVASTLARALATALELGPVPAAAEAAWLVDALVGVPIGTALLCDDAHVLPPDSDGVALLRRLVEQKPAQLGVVIAARHDPGFASAAARARSDVVDVDEAALRFDSDERARYAALRGVAPAAFDAVAGWPALCDLAGNAPAAALDDFVWTHVLDALPEPTRHQLAYAAAIGPCDAALLAAVAEADVDLDALAEVPLVRRSESGIEVHRLWSERGGLALRPDEAAHVHRICGEVYCERDELDATIEHFAIGDDPDALCATIGQACRRSHLGSRLDVLARWLAFVPATHRERPEVLLLDGIRRRVTAPFDPVTVDVLRRSFEGLRTQPDRAIEVAAAAEYAFVLRSRGDMHEFERVAARVLELAQDPATGAMAFVHFGAAVFAEQADDDVAVHEHLRAIAPGALPRNWFALAETVRAQSFLSMGRSQEAFEAASRASEYAGHATGPAYALAVSRWWCRVDVEAVDTLAQIDPFDAAAPMNTYLPALQLAVPLAFAGRLPQARRLVGLAAAIDRSLLRPELRALFSVGQAALAAAEGDDDAARAALGEWSRIGVFDDPGVRRAMKRAIGLVHVLLADLRPEIDALDLGADLADCRATAQVLETLREGRSPQGPALRAGLLHPFHALPLPMLAELACRLLPVDSASATRLTTDLMAVYRSFGREALRQRRDDPELGEPARTLLANVPAPPMLPTAIAVFGTTDVLVGGRPNPAPELRRDRVRQLLCFVAIHRRVSREAVIGALWPDLDDTAARRNLRVNLTHLQKVLEPDRASGERPFVLSQDGSGLALADPAWVSVDTDRFEALCRSADALERSGSHDRCLDQLERALALVRGEPLADVADEPWAAPVRRELTATAVRACVKAASLRHARGDHARAIAHATRALTLEPWSEPAFRVVIAAHLALGERAAAMRALHDCQAMLAELQLSPEPETVQLVRRLERS